MISEIAEHTVDLSLLPEKAIIADIGCRGFGFSDYFRELGHKVFSIDIDQLNEGKAYYKLGITDFNGMIGVDRSNDPQATKVKPGHEIPCYTIATFMEVFSVKFFDLIKMDVEGAEYQIIMSLEKAPAKQLSIEFHLHTGIYGQHEMMLMEDKLKSLGYEAVQHKLEARHCAGYNYWDSFFILK